MAGIVSYGAYIPKYRLGKETVGWGTPQEKAVANFDEDSVTMAVAAGADCLAGLDRQKVDGLFFASTTSPYSEKEASVTVATALDLRRDILTGDYTSSLRAGAIALRSAIDAVASGRAKQVLVAMADSRMGAPKGDFDRASGDGAAAFLVADTGAAVTIEGSFAIADQIMDVWRLEGEPFVRTSEDRFVIDEGFIRNMDEAAKGLFSKLKLTAKDITKAVLYAPDARRHSEVARRLGLQPPQLQDPMFNGVGNAGTSSAPMALVGALEDAKVGDRILLAVYGDGAETFALKVEGKFNHAGAKRAIKKHLASKLVLPNYDLYLRWRQLVPQEAARRPPPPVPSVMALWRERDQNIRLYGMKCKSCGRIQYPPQRVCTYCHAKDERELVRLSDKKGEVFTYSMDYLAGTPDIPLVITIVNFEGGGRMLCMMTDREIDKMKVGLPVEMSFRKLHTVAGIPNYYWKSTPVRV